MSNARKKYTSVDEYVADFPKATQEVMEKIRSIMKKNIPDYEEVISYNIPCFKYKGKYVIYFAGFTNHVSVYPIFDGSDEFNKELEPYKKGRGTVQFQLDEPIRYDLIEMLTKYRLEDTKQKLKVA